jgi:hypothetical protein
LKEAGFLVCFHAKAQIDKSGLFLFD